MSLLVVQTRLFSLVRARCAGCVLAELRALECGQARACGCAESCLRLYSFGLPPSSLLAQLLAKAQCFFFVEPSVSFLSDRCKAFSSALALLSLSSTTTLLIWHTVVTASPNAAMRDQPMTYIRSMANALEQPTSMARCKSRSLVMTMAAISVCVWFRRRAASAVVGKNNKPPTTKAKPLPKGTGAQYY